MTKLYSWCRDAITLTDALQTLAKPLTGFCMSPARFCFAHWQDTKQLQLGQDPPAINQIYEARFFNAELELRWLRDPAGDGTGMAVRLSESDINLADWQANVTLDVEPLPDSYRLMTGTLSTEIDEKTQWPLMNAPRHGKVAVPVKSSTTGGRLAYLVREYLGPAPGKAGEDGNRMVVEERIIELTIYVTSKEKSHAK